MPGYCWPNGSKSKPWVSSPFGPRRAPVPGASTYHRGADFSHTFRRIRAVADGRVVAVGTPRGWSGGGTQVWIQHDGFFSKSLHMVAGSPVVHVNQIVTAGEDLGEMGETGTATDVHLHFEITPGTVHYNNTGQVDPVPFLSTLIAAPASGGGGIEITMDKETLIGWIQEWAKYRSRDGGGADYKGGATLYERINAALSSLGTLVGLVNPDENSGGKGWLPFRNALSRWLIYHSRADGPDGKGATIHERLNQIENAVHASSGGDVKLTIDAATLAIALADPKVAEAFAGPISKRVSDDIAKRMVS